MFAGENLRSLKPRNKNVMRNAIFDIFKALRHFGVSANEVNGVAQAYKFWIKNQVEGVKEYRRVYYYKGVLYAMPYPIPEIESAFVGIEIDGVIYLAGYQCNVAQDKVAESLMWLKGVVFNKFTPETRYGVEVPNNIKLKLPTWDEVKNLVTKTSNDADVDGVVYSRFSCYWVVSSTNKEDKPAAVSWFDFTSNNLPQNRSEAHVQPVIRLRKGIDFIGCLNHFGVPNDETKLMTMKLIAYFKKT